MTSSNKYMVKIVGRTEDNEPVSVLVDVYDVLKAFSIDCPALAHALKKMLKPGSRGHKDSIQDKQEAIVSIWRSIDMEKQDEEVGN